MVTTPATCTGMGTQTRYCNCGESQIESISIKDHSWIDATYTAPKTCANCGKTEGTVLEKPMPAAEFQRSYFTLYYTTAYFMSRARIDDIKATVKEQTDGNYYVALILKGTMISTPRDMSMPVEYTIYIYNADGEQLCSEKHLSSMYNEGDSVSIYETIFNLPYSESYEIRVY